MQERLSADLAFMDEALRCAQAAADEGEVPVGAVVVHSGRIIGRGWNKREQWQDFSAHAEFLAMREAAAALGTWRLEECTVYVTLEPCPMCAGAMVLGRIHRCVFGTTDPKGGFCGSLGDLSHHEGLNHSFEVVGGVRADESSRMLRAFFRRLRRR